MTGRLVAVCGYLRTCRDRQQICAMLNANVFFTINVGTGNCMHCFLCLAFSPDVPFPRPAKGSRGLALGLEKAHFVPETHYHSGCVLKTHPCDFVILRRRYQTEASAGLSQ